MRINIVIDNALIAEAMMAAGVKTKREAVEFGLKALVALREQSEVRQFRGKLNWTGDLEAMRREA